MGVNYIFKKSANLKKYSNTKLKIEFYYSLTTIGEQNNNWNPNTSVFLVGKRDKFSVINLEAQLEMLKRVKKFSYEIGKKDAQILYVNDSTNTKFDGMIKTLSYRSEQAFTIGRWPCGILTKSQKFNIAGILLFNPDKARFSIKEANKLGLPIISLNSLNVDVSKTLYPIICNNSDGNSVFLNTHIITDSILEGKLFRFTKAYLKKFKKRYSSMAEH